MSENYISVGAISAKKILSVLIQPKVLTKFIARSVIGNIWGRGVRRGIACVIFGLTIFVEFVATRIW